MDREACAHLCMSVCEAKDHSGISGRGTGTTRWRKGSFFTAYPFILLGIAPTPHVFLLTLQGGDTPSPPARPASAIAEVTCSSDQKDMRPPPHATPLLDAPSSCSQSRPPSSRRPQLLACAPDSWATRGSEQSESGTPTPSPVCG